MKRILLLIAFLFVRSQLSAQDLVVNIPDNPVCSYRPYYLDTLGIDQGGDGTGQVWDFRNNHIYDSSTVFYLQKLDKNPFKELFPRANYWITNDERSLIYFLYSDRNVVANCGAINYYKDLIVRRIKEDKVDTQIEYPVFYGQKKKTREYRYTDYQQSDSTESDIHFLKSWKVDGSGTIITPDSKEYTVLRVKIVYNIETKVYKNGPAGRTYLYKQLTTATHYNWISPDEPYGFVFIYTRDYTRSEGPYAALQISTSRQATYYKSTRKFSAPDYNATNLHVTKDMVSRIQVAYTCHQSETGVIQVINMSGSTVLRLDVNSPEHQPVENIQELNTSMLLPGIYVITYTSDKERGVTKWVKK